MQNAKCRVQNVKKGFEIEKGSAKLITRANQEQLNFITNPQKCQGGIKNG